MSEFKHIHTFKEHKGAVYAMCEGKTEGEVFSAGADRHVIQWNLETKEAEKVIARSPTTVISLLYLKEYNYLLIGQVEGGVHVIDLAEGKEVKYLKNHECYIFDMEFITDKQELLLASGDGSFSVWSIPDFKLLFHKKIGEKKVREVDYSLSKQQIAIAVGDGKVELRSSVDYSLIQTWDHFSSAVNVVRFSPGNELLVGEKDALLSSINLESMETTPAIPAHYWAIYDIRFSPDGKYFATASRDKTVKIWDAASMKVLKRFEGVEDQGHSHSVNKLLWLSYKNYLLSTGDDGSIKIWQIES